MASKQAAAALAKAVKGKNAVKGKKKAQKELPDPFLKVTIKYILFSNISGGGQKFQD